jgi:Mandelate racemase / muconate lactonizing enzyme, N-terminal domain
MTLSGVVVRSVLVPLAPPLQTASGIVSEAPIMLIDLLTERGITGRSYLFCFTPLVLAPMTQLVHDIAVFGRGMSGSPGVLASGSAGDQKAHGAHSRSTPSSGRAPRRAGNPPVRPSGA